MKVSCAAQVLSHTVSSVISLLSRFDKSLKNGSGTAKILKFCNDLFDSVNRRSLNPRRGNFRRCALTQGSKHLDFWQNPRKYIGQMYFERNGKKFTPPSLKNWIITLNGFEAIVLKLKNGGIMFVKTRVFNQDPLENFFGQVRQ